MDQNQVYYYANQVYLLSPFVIAATVCSAQGNINDGI